MPEDISYKLADYDGGLDAHPVPERAGQLWLVGSWWELHFKHKSEFANGELTDYMLEALPIDTTSCLVSIRELDSDREILCSFVLPDTPADRFTADLDHRLGEIAGAEGNLMVASDHAADDRGPTDNIQAGLAVSMRTTVGQELQLLRSDSSPNLRLGQTMAVMIRASSPRHSSTTDIDATRSVPHYGYELRAPGGRVASFDLSGRAGLASMACAQGSWRLNKRRPLGWDLVIETDDGAHVGSYSGNHWLPGGVIALADMTKVELRRTRRRTWNLRVPDTRAPVLDMRTHGFPWLLTIRAVPAEIYSHVEIVVLTTCAVLLLDMLMSSAASSSQG